MTKPTNWHEAFGVAADAAGYLRGGLDEHPDCDDDPPAWPVQWDAPLRRHKPATTTGGGGAGPTHVVALAVGDAQRLVPPGEVVKLVVFPQVHFQLVGLRLTQYPGGDAAGGAPAHWPVEACFVGAAVVMGPMALYDGAAERITCQLGQCVELRVRNPLAVPAAVCGALLGRTYAPGARFIATAALARPGRGAPAVPAPLTAAQLEEMVREASGADDPVRCAVCNVDLKGMATWNDDGRTYCKLCWHRREEKRRLTTLLSNCVDCGVPTGLPDPATVPAKRGVETKFPATAKELLRALGDPPGWQASDVSVAAPRRVIYCEAAPPRAVVEAATCLLDGDECGAPALHPHLRAPLRYTARMLVAWERHDAFAARERDRRGVPWFNAAARADHDTVPSAAPDAYGGKVLVAIEPPRSGPGCCGYRCALCGAWLREVAL